MDAVFTRAGKAAPLLALLLARATLGLAATPPSLDLMPQRDLRFGTVVVPEAGSRTVSASGTVTNEGIMPMGYGSARPAAFTLTYDRGAEENRPISITVEVVLSSIPPVSDSGVTGSLSSFDTDLGGGLVTLIPGQPITYTISNCTSRVCSVDFHVGARLTVTRSTGGANLSLYPPITARVLMVAG